MKHIITAKNLDVSKITEETLALVSLITSQPVIKETVPIIGTYLVVNGKRVIQNEPYLPEGLHIAYEWNEDQSLSRMYIGSSWHGPMLSWCEEGWRNLYGHGNHGKNYSHGGTWSASSSVTFSTIKAALRERNYEVNLIQMKRNQMTESLKVLGLLSQIEE